MINNGLGAFGVDIFSTVLENIGADIPSRRLGAGVSLQTLIEGAGKKRLNKELYKKVTDILNLFSIWNKFHS